LLQQQTTHGKLQERKGPKRSPSPSPPPPPPPNIVMSKITMQHKHLEPLHMPCLSPTAHFQYLKDPTIGPELWHKTSGKPLSLSLSLSFSYICFWELAGALDTIMLTNKKELVSCSSCLTFFLFGNCMCLTYMLTCSLKKINNNNNNNNKYLYLKKQEEEETYYLDI
jgi:hypothetical protein